jgi:hypothetical protein
MPSMVCRLQVAEVEVGVLMLRHSSLITGDMLDFHLSATYVPKPYASGPL